MRRGLMPHPARTLVVPFQCERLIGSGSQSAARDNNYFPDSDNSFRSKHKFAGRKCPAPSRHFCFSADTVPFLTSSSIPSTYGKSQKIRTSGELQDRKRVSPFRQLRERVHVRENDHLLLVRDVSLHKSLINLVRQQTLDFFHRQLHPRDDQCRMEDPDRHPVPL